MMLTMIPLPDAHVSKLVAMQPANAIWLPALTWINGVARRLSS